MVSFTQLLEKLKHLPISVADLKVLVPPKCNVVKLKDLKGRHRSDVFKGSRGIIVLLPSKISKVGHYICLIPRKHHIEYFSSLGNSPQKESTLLHTDEGILTTLLGTNFVYNRKKLQGGDFKIRSCAMFCVARLYMSDLKLREFQQMFSKSVTLSTPDDIVSILCLLSFSEV